MLATRPTPALNDAALAAINAQRLAEQNDPNRPRMTSRRQNGLNFSKSSFSRAIKILGFNPYHLVRVIMPFLKS